jgi:hypothetical protein
MKKTKLALLPLLAWLGCQDAQNDSLQIAFNLPTSDQLQAMSSGVCTCTPQSTAQATYLAGGFLEVNPILNPGAVYNLNLQVENYLDTTLLVDSNGTTISGAQRNDFKVERAEITYLDTGGFLPPVPTQTAIVSADVRAGGLTASSCVPIQAVSNGVAQAWASAMSADAGTAIDVVVLEVQLFGQLASGSSFNSGLFHYPITICTDCLGALPVCTGAVGKTLVAHGHGPCCASQDFDVSCDGCGGLGQPCCGPQGAQFCNAAGDGGSLACTLNQTNTVEICSFNFAEASTCQKPSL